MTEQTERVRAGSAYNKSEVLLVTLLILAAFAIRIYRLGVFPDTFLADEADNAQDAIRILYGLTPENGFFGLDWTSQPAFSAYKEAFFVALFGTRIAALRLSSALLTTLALIPFYVLLRRQFSMITSLLATTLMATNVWYLNFSRSGWNCSDIGLYMLMAMLFLMLALDAMNATDQPRWRKWSLFAASGFFCALGLYGYPAGRAVTLGVAAFFPVAWLFNSRHRKTLLLGYVLLFEVTALLFLPQARYIARHWEYFNGRSKVVVITNKPAYQADPIATMMDQVRRNVQSPWVGAVNNTPQYSPSGEPQLDRVTGVLTLLGMFLCFLVPKFRKRPETYLWGSMLLIGWASTQLFTVNTPNGARGIGYMPTLIYFSAVSLEVVFILFDQFQGKFSVAARMQQVVTAIIIGFILWTGYSNVVHYVAWQNDPRTRQARYLYITAREFPEWASVITGKARNGEGILNVGQWRELYPIEDIADPYNTSP